MHADTRDGGAPGLVAWLEEEAPGSGAGPGPATGSDGWSDAARTRAERLRAWAAAGAPTDAALFSRWRDALVRRVAADPALAPLHAPHGLPAVFSPWLDVVARVGDALAEILASGVVGSRAAAAAALADLDDLHDLAAPDGGADAVTWGDLHRLAPLHALDLVPGATAPVVPRVPLGGTGDAVRCTGGVPGVTTAAFRGSVARWVWDLGDRRRSRWGVPFGASGDPRSPHFADQHPAWAAARTTVIETDWARLRPEPVPAPTDDPRRPR